MQIRGKWLMCDDGVTRPVVVASVLAAENEPRVENFLVDSGADRTVLSASILAKLQLAATEPVPGTGLVGVGGQTPYVLITATLIFVRDGGVARVRGELAAFTDPVATDFSVLGRDVLNHFDVILSRQREEVLLLAPNHRYQVTQTS